MLGRTFEDQKMQKLLNYEIKMIEGCTDSLFTEADCQHQRYLTWGLCQNLKNLLKKYCYTLRWIGNEPHSYVYAYFYAVIMGCAANPDFMVQLKTVLYDLAQKYLALFEQKLLVQFLCLIGYCQERYIFFRKYSKIEEILLKIFKQIQERNSYQLQVSVEPRVSEQSSASKSNHGRYVVESNSQKDVNLVNSTSNSNAITIQQQKHQSNDKGMWKSKQDYSFIKWYEIYNQYFPFLCMNNLTEENIQLSIDLPKRGIHDIDSFVITIEKGCFFIVELMLIRKETETHQKEDRSINVEATKAYRDGLLKKEIQESRIIKDVIFPNQTSKYLKNQISPKLFTNPKTQNFGKANFQNANFKDWNYDNNKSRPMRQVIPQQTPSSETSIVPLKSNTVDLHSVKNIVDSNRPYRNALRQQIRSHPLYEQYKKQIRVNQKKQKPEYPQKKLSRFAQFIQKTRQPKNVMKQNRSMDSSSHQAIDNLKKMNPSTNISYTNQNIKTQDSIVQRMKLQAEKRQLKLETGLTLPTYTKLPTVSKINDPTTKLYNFSNVRTVYSPDRRMKSTSPTNRIPSKASVNVTEGIVLKLGAKHKTQISFG